MRRQSILVFSKDTPSIEIKNDIQSELCNCKNLLAPQLGFASNLSKFSREETDVARPVTTPYSAKLKRMRQEIRLIDSSNVRFGRPEGFPRILS